MGDGEVEGFSVLVVQCLREFTLSFRGLLLEDVSEILGLVSDVLGCILVNETVCLRCHQKVVSGVDDDSVVD